MQKNTKETPRFKFKDAEFIKEFPGILKCAIRCDKGIVTDDNLEDIRPYINDVGMCQVYKGQSGHFAIFYASDLTIITTIQGVYTNYSCFHSFRSEEALFVFEEDGARYEEAFCTMIDISYGFHLLKQQAFNSVVENILNELRRNENNDTEED